MFVFKEAGGDRSLEELGDELAGLASEMTAAMCRWLLLLAEFDRRGGWSADGCVSCAHWVSWRCGVSPVTAREHVRIAGRLDELPLARDAFARGELSYSKVRALARVENVQDEAELVELARQASASQLERIVAVFRGVTREQADAAYLDRSLELFGESDGTVHVHGRLPADLGAIVVAAVREAEARLEARVEGTERLPGGKDRPPAAARRADALVWLAQTACAAPDDAGRVTSGRVEVTVQVDAAVLTAPEDATGRSELSEGAPLAAETIRRLCCDAGIVPTVVDEAGGVLDVGRRTRSIPPAIRRALTLRDAGCRFPGCDRTRWLDAHHVEHWAHGGATSLDNLVLLCHHHHQLVHEGGFALMPADEGAGGGGGFAAVAPDGRRLEPVPAAAAAATGPVGVLDWPTGPGPDSLAPLGADGPFDLGYAVGAVAHFTGLS